VFQQDPLTLQLVSRLREFFDHRTPWQRSLWMVSSPLALHEVLEYAESVRVNQVPTDGLKYAVEATMAQCRQDPGTGPAGLQAELERCLRKLGAAKEQAFRNGELDGTLDYLEQIAVRSRSNYVTRWGDVLTKDPADAHIERAARSIAAHVLDEGFSADHLHGWLTRLDRAQDSILSVRDLCSEIDSDLATLSRVYRVLVPFLDLPEIRPTSTTLTYLDATQTRAWLTAEGVSKPGVRWTGSLLLEVEARDPWAAVERAAEVVARVGARTAVSLEHRRLQPSGKAWIAGRDGSFDLEQRRRKVRIPALQRSDDLYVVGTYAKSRDLDDALELLSSMAMSAPGAALSNGWAAVEALLVHPAERHHVQAADRMAAIVACSLPRAELTRLSGAAFEGADGLRRDLDKATTATARVERLERALRGGTKIRFAAARDQAACNRVKKLITDPVVSLGNVRWYLAQAFRRLYHQRNVIMHSGRFQSVVMRATLRTVPPLAAAGLDRIVMAYQIGPRNSALKLAARAALELDLVGSDAARTLGTLLEH
jgi:hypothetical protein